VDILSKAQHEVLAFVAACNRSSYNPTATQVLLWQNNRSPAPAEYRTIRRNIGPLASIENLPTTIDRMVASIAASLIDPLRQISVTEQELVRPAETVVEHMLHLTWLEEVQTPSGEEPGLRLTDLGRALLRDAETNKESNEDVSVVVLGRDDPLAYPVLVGQLAAAGTGLLVDPYLKLADLHTIVVSTRLTRLLVSGKTNNRSVIASMKAYLGSRVLARQIEVRSSTELHDRILIADAGDVLTIGTSLNGVGRTTTVMTPIPPPARESLRREYERLWSEATLVNPEPAQKDAEIAPDNSVDNRAH
jgi:hypothetical protein